MAYNIGIKIEIERYGMEVRINKNMDEIKERCKKKRKQLINLIIVLLCGVYCVVFEEHVMFEIMGWFMIVVGSFLIFFCHMRSLLSDLLFPLRKFMYKCRKRKLHFKYEPEKFKDYEN